MDIEELQRQLRASEQRNEELQRSMQQVLQEQQALRRDHDALVDATRSIVNERDSLRKRVAELEAANNRLVDMLWGRRTERRSESPDQQHLDFGEDPEPPSAAEQQIVMAQAKADEASDEELLRRLRARQNARREKKASQERFPEHLERRERMLDLSDEEKAGLKCIGVKVTERLRFEKPYAYVEVIKRPQYVVPGRPEEGVQSVPPPLSIVEGCTYDFSVIAAIVAMKFAFHMPTYRQQDWYAQCGWFPSRSTINDLINYGVDTIVPLHEQMWRLLLADPIMLGDDTTLTVLLRGGLSEEELATLSTRNRFRQAAEAGLPPNTGPPGSAASYAWLYTGLDGMAPYNVFHWSLTHQNAVIDGHLASFRGIFVGDAAGANARLQQRSDGRIIHASCNTHARREFVKAESNDPILASQAISFYRQLYDVEERGKTLDAAARYELRQREAVPIWRRMGQWLASDATKRVLPKSAIGGALGYLRNQWDALQVYLSDGRIPIDNDQSEQMIRPLTVGRGNWLFLGHPRAAAGRLRMYSVVSSAHRHHLVLDDYLEDVLKKLADAQQNHPADLEPGSPYLLDLLPDRWAAAHPKSVRGERIEEREEVADAKRYRRAQARLHARAAKRNADQ
ncbi:MAG: IS66 family transposase [Phycisphaerae bacterium]|nr:IS66 family transposase [Phycisphaerae bacterium]